MKNMQGDVVKELKVRVRQRAARKRTVCHAEDERGSKGTVGVPETRHLYRGGHQGVEGAAPHGLIGRRRARAAGARVAPPANDIAHTEWMRG